MQKILYILFILISIDLQSAQASILLRRGYGLAKNSPNLSSALRMAPRYISTTKPIDEKNLTNVDKKMLSRIRIALEQGDKATVE